MGSDNTYHAIKWTMQRALEIMNKKDMDIWGISEFHRISCKTEEQANFSLTIQEIHRQTNILQILSNCIFGSWTL